MNCFARILLDHLSAVVSIYPKVVLDDCVSPSGEAGFGTSGCTIIVIVTVFLEGRFLINQT